ncbi:spermidine synthase [Propioniciclava soli]|uniref:spermidine synthase n=1 Tax=Propioniciclava soli TaxID=2775081 RepID=UPI001E56FE94|nr:fused MFS/spermidine synthase [Propioniciclava soli]
MRAHLEADPFHPGAFRVVAGETSQSYVNPDDPLHLEFEYVQRITEALGATVLARPADERVRVVHLGGGGLSIPRWVAARRPGTAQIVCEPDADLVDDVRRLLPLPKQSGIKVRVVDGRSGLAAMPPDFLDALVLDAFDGPRVPASLTTAEFFDDLALRRRRGAVLCANITDRAPFGWARRFVAGVRGSFRQVMVSAESPVWKGRRFGNLVVVASDAVLPATELSRLAARAAFPYRVLAGREVVDWISDASPFTDADAQASPVPKRGTWFS